MTNLDARASIQYLIDAYEVECRETVMLIKPQDYEAFKAAIKALDNEIGMEKLHRTTCEECIQRAQDYFDLAKEDSDG